MRLFITATSLLLFAAVGADAQSTTTRIAIAGGLATDQSGVRSSALALSPSVFVESPHFSAQLGGSFTRFGTNAYSTGAGLSSSAAQPFGAFAALTLAGSAAATRLQGASRGTFAQADITPALEIRLRPLTLFGGARVASGASSESSPTSTLPVPGRSSSKIARAGAGPAFGAVLALAGERVTLRAGAREERLRIAGNTTPERSLNVELAVGMTATTSLEIAAGRYDGNRLLDTPAGEYATVGIAWRFGGRRDAELPAEHGARPASAGMTRLSLRAPNARRVEVAGDFNEWSPMAATRAANGVWYADLKIPPGQYRYAFRVDGVEWRVPDGATAVDDGFGGKAAWLTVSDARSRR